MLRLLVSNVDEDGDKLERVLESVWLMTDDECEETVVDITSELELLLSTAVDTKDDSEDSVLVWLGDTDETVVELAPELLRGVSFICELESVRDEVSDELTNSEVEDAPEPVL